MMSTAIYLRERFFSTWSFFGTMFSWNSILEIVTQSHGCFELFPTVKCSLTYLGGLISLIHEYRVCSLVQGIRQRSSGPGRGRTRQWQAGIKWGQAGTIKEPAGSNRDKQGQEGTSLVKDYSLSLLVPCCLLRPTLTWVFAFQVIS